MSLLDKLNLRPQERRLLVGIMVVIFILLNVLFVWPLFGEWGKERGALANAQDKLYKYNKKISQVHGVNGFETKLKKLEGENLNSVVGEEQEIQLFRTVQNQINESKVTVTRYGEIRKASTTQTNEFFEEQSIIIEVNTGEKELIDFLVKVGSGSSMIRVRDLSLKPADANRYRLAGTITLSANYQKKPVGKPVAKPATAAAPASHPATAPPKSAAPVPKPIPAKPTAAPVRKT